MGKSTRLQAAQTNSLAKATATRAAPPRPLLRHPRAALAVRTAPGELQPATLLSAESTGITPKTKQRAEQMCSWEKSHFASSAGQRPFAGLQRGELVPLLATL